MSKTISDWSGRTCAVLGGKGFVGSAIAAAWKQRGANVSVIDTDEYATAVGQEFDVLINANGNSRKYLAAKDPALEFDLSVRSVALCLRDFQIGLYVHLSTVDVYPDHENPARNSEAAAIDPARLSPYGLHKYMAEQLAVYYPKRWLIFRMAGFVGPGLWKNSVHDLLKGQALRVHPDSQYQYLHTRDLARIVLDLVESGCAGEVFNICGNGLVSLREVAAMIPGCDLAGLPSDLPRERYNINVDKLKLYAALPDTGATVREFVEAVGAGREPLR